MNTTAKVLVLPDIHGRTFWKECIKTLKKEIDAYLIDVVFLGDYMDPYGFEGISVDDALKNFREIVKFAKNKTNVHLLLGNHDMHYFDTGYAHSIYKVRYSYEYADSIKRLFKRNKSMFKLAWQTRVNDKNILFTHAGVLKSWIDVHRGDLRVWHGSISEDWIIPDLEPTPESLNKLLDNRKGIYALTDVSEERGGRSAYASMIWADVHDHFSALNYCPPGRDEINYYKDFYQVFGHSLAYLDLDSYCITDEFAMLDSRQGFIIEDSGEIKPFKEIYDKR